MAAVVGTDLSAGVLLAVTLVAWWIAWRSIETLVSLAIAVMVYSLCSDTGFPSVVTSSILAVSSFCAGLGYWAPASLKILENGRDGA